MSDIRPSSEIDAAQLRRFLGEAAAKVRRLQSQLDAARHEAQAATKLVLEHQSKNCHLHAEIERLRAALRDALDAIIKMDGLGDGDGTIAENAEKAIREALGE